MSPGVIERAYQLAQSGECRNLEEIKRRLGQEGYDSVSFHLAGKLTKDQLKGLMKANGDGASVSA